MFRVLVGRSSVHGGSGEEAMRVRLCSAHKMHNKTKRNMHAGAKQKPCFFLHLHTLRVSCLANKASSSRRICWSFSSTCSSAWLQRCLFASFTCSIRALCSSASFSSSRRRRRSRRRRSCCRRCFCRSSFWFMTSKRTDVRGRYAAAG